MRYKVALTVSVMALALLLCAPFWKKKDGEKKAIKAETEKQISINPGFPFQESEIFFTDPYTYLEPPVKDRIGMSLDIDYTRVRYPYGFVNTVSPDKTPIKYKKRIKVEDEEELKRIKEMSGFEKGNPVTVISVSGNAFPARVAGFSYVGNSPSTVIVAADLEIEADSPDKSLFNSPGLAIRGKREIGPGGLSAEDPLEPDAPLFEKLFGLCAGDRSSGYEFENKTVLPAELVEGEGLYYFVSFWRHPAEDYEIDDVELKTCILHSQNGVWRKMVLPIPLELIQVYDLDGNGRAELFATTGNSSRMCLSFLVPQGKGYRVMREGLCSGY